MIRLSNVTEADHGRGEAPAPAHTKRPALSVFPPSATDAGDPFQELTLAEAAQVMPGRPHKGTIQRWIQKGVRVGRGPAAETVRLAARKSGGRWYVTPAALAAFRDATTPAFRLCEEPPKRRAHKPTRTVADGSRFQRAMSRLAARGLTGSTELTA